MGLLSSLESNAACFKVHETVWGVINTDCFKVRETVRVFAEQTYQVMKAEL